MRRVCDRVSLVARITLLVGMVALSAAGTRGMVRLTHGAGPMLDTARWLFSYDSSD